MPDSLFAQLLSKFSLVYLLVWHPPLHTPYIPSPNHCLLFAAHAHTIKTCFAIVPKLYHLILVSLNSLLGTLSFSLMPHIHLTILISACWSVTSFSFLRGQVSLPCNIHFHTLRLSIQIWHKYFCAIFRSVKNNCHNKCCNTYSTNVLCHLRRKSNSPTVLLVVVENEVEIREEASLGPTEEAVVPLEDDVAMLQAEVEEVPQDDRKTFHYNIANKLWHTMSAVSYTLIIREWQQHHKWHSTIRFMKVCRRKYRSRQLLRTLVWTGLQMAGVVVVGVRSAQMAPLQVLCLWQAEKVGRHHVLAAVGLAMVWAHTQRLVALVLVHCGVETIPQPELVPCDHQPQMPNASCDSVPQHSVSQTITDNIRYNRELQRIICDKLSL